jgi:[acyl-carrier-protein] S-malonyltransferase
LIAFVFPGQGSQAVGMGVELAEAYPEARRAFEEASEGAGLDLLRLCREGPEERLVETELQQPAILAASAACLAALRANGRGPGAAAGLSLGEYAALVAAGALDVGPAAGLVRQRGRFMQEAVPAGAGAMAAILGLDGEAVRRVCQEASGDQVVEPANYNCPGQVVVSGHREAVERAVASAKRAGARRAVLLPVSAPFHCRLLRPAAERLAPLLEAAPLRAAAVPVVANATAEVVRDPGEIRAALVAQVASPVLWDGCVQRLLELGARTFVEVGPGTALSGFVRRIAPDAVVRNCQDRDSLERALEVC